MKCNYCEWHCELTETTPGVCKMYHLSEGQVAERFPDRWYTYGLTQIEALPFYHAYPGSRSLAVGTTGCNFDCRYCINAYVVKGDPRDILPEMYELTATELMGIVKKLGCHNIVFNTNEPTMSLPTLTKVYQLAQREGIPMGCLTNAYTTEAATEQLAEIFSFINISLKGLSPDFYREYVGIADGAAVLRNIRRLARTNHLEITTPVIEDVNDDEMEEMAEFIAGVNRNIPWHVFRLQPERQMKDSAYPSVEKINGALGKIRKMLPYVYFHNFIGSDWVNTLCPRCGTSVIERLSLGCGGDILDACHCETNLCPACGQEIYLCGQRTEWNSREVL
ncbi:MAG TPA: radical SAM protein [Patescibacteria group bacterium]|nr:radical SAM protein [Patescibacteria group bacterium]